MDKEVQIQILKEIFRHFPRIRPRRKFTNAPVTLYEIAEFVFRCPICGKKHAINPMRDRGLVRVHGRVIGTFADLLRGNLISPK